jgi:hypothetical protein
VVRSRICSPAGQELLLEPVVRLQHAPELQGGRAACLLVVCGVRSGCATACVLQSGLQATQLCVQLSLLLLL